MTASAPTSSSSSNGDGPERAVDILPREAMESSSSFPPADSQIPVDYKVKKSLLRVGGDNGLTAYDARGNLTFRVTDSPLCASGSAAHRTKTLSNAAGHPRITVVYKNGEWQGFRGSSSNLNDLIFTVQKALSSEVHTELDVFFPERKVDEKPIFRVRGNPFRRSCVIISGDSIVAEANLFYRLNKRAYSRRKFQVTVYPGNDHIVVLAMVMIFIWR